MNEREQEELEDPVVVLRCASLRSAREHGLVLLAMGIDHAIFEREGAFDLCVRASAVVPARLELQRYSSEDRAFRPRGEPFAIVSSGARGAILFGLALTTVFVLERADALELDWWERGISRASLVRGGEWWRALTSLSLHSDLSHLAGNIVFGALFGVLVAQLLGEGVAWCAIALTGFVGNAVNALVQPPEHGSVGASTAVFGALGVLVGYEWRRRRRLHLGALRRWAPPVLGACLLGYLGTAGERTDVMAHVLGFVAGALIGLPLARADERGLLASRSLQVAAGLCVPLALVAAWRAALCTR